MSGQDAARHFATLAGDYDRSRSHRDGRTLALLLEHAAPRPHDRAADVGTGSGHTAMALAPRVARIAAVDVTEGMLRQTRQSARAAGHSNVDVVRAAAEALPFPDGALDLVVSRTAVHHFDAPVQAIAEMRRVLAPGGRVVVSDQAAADDPSLRELQHRVEVLHDATHRRTWTPEEWRRALASGGFEDVRVEGGVDARLRELDEGTLVSQWCRRSRTPPEAEAEIRRLLTGAPEAHRQVLAVEGDEGPGGAVAGEAAPLHFDIYKLVVSARVPARRS